MIAFPTATRKSAFIAGITLVVFIAGLEALAHFELLPAGASEKEMFPVVAAYFFITVLLFIVDVKSFCHAN